MLWSFPYMCKTGLTVSRYRRAVALAISRFIALTAMDGISISPLMAGNRMKQNESFLKDTAHGSGTLAMEPIL